MFYSCGDSNENKTLIVFPVITGTFHHILNSAFENYRFFLRTVTVIFTKYFIALYYTNLKSMIP